MLLYTRVKKMQDAVTNSSLTVPSFHLFNIPHILLFSTIHFPVLYSAAEVWERTFVMILQQWSDGLRGASRQLRKERKKWRKKEAACRPDFDALWSNVVFKHTDMTFELLDVMLDSWPPHLAGETAMLGKKSRLRQLVSEIQEGNFEDGEPIVDID